MRMSDFERTLQHFMPVSLLLAALPAPVSAACSLGMVASMPLTYERGHFVFAADINNHDANLVLDTGSFATTLNLAATDKLGVRVGQAGEVEGIGGTQTLYRGTASRMRFGGLEADGMMLGAAALWDPKRFPNWDGLFGMNMMAAYDVDLDFTGHKASLFLPQGDCRKPAVTLQQPLYAVPLISIVHDRQTVLAVTLDGHRMKALLDTGTPRTTLYRHSAQRIGLDLSALSATSNMTVRGVGTLDVPAMKHVFPTVVIGSLTLHDMPIDIVAQRSTGVDRHHTGSLIESDTDDANGDTAGGDDPGGEDMLLGADFMQAVHVWISHSSQTLIMQYPPKPSPVIN